MTPPSVVFLLSFFACAPDDGAFFFFFKCLLARRPLRLSNPPSRGLFLPVTHLLHRLPPRDCRASRVQR